MSHPMSSTFVETTRRSGSFYVHSTWHEAAMPYRTVKDLPEAQTDQYNAHQKEAFLKAFNSAYEQYDHDESRAFAVAHSAAKKAGERPGPG